MIFCKLFHAFVEIDILGMLANWFYPIVIVVDCIMILSLDKFGEMNEFRVEKV